jgi:PAS domain S-box-containing protein
LAGGERRFRAIFEASPDCIKLVSAEGRLIDINAAGLRMIEADCASQVRGVSLLDLIDPAYHQSFRDGVAAVLAGKTTRMHFEVVGLRGRRLFMDQTAAPLFAHDEPSGAVEMVAVTRNVSAERRAEANLLQVRLAQELTRSAAHHAASLGQRLKTPLETITGYPTRTETAPVSRSTPSAWPFPRRQTCSINVCRRCSHTRSSTCAIDLSR